MPLIDNRDDRPMNRPVPEDADSRAPHANDSRQWKLFLLAAILIVSGLTLYVGDTRLHNSAVASAAPSDRMERIQ